MSWCDRYKHIQTKNGHLVHTIVTGKITNNVAGKWETIAHPLRQTQPARYASASRVLVASVREDRITTRQGGLGQQYLPQADVEVRLGRHDEVKIRYMVQQFVLVHTLNLYSITSSRIPSHRVGSRLPAEMLDCMCRGEEYRLSTTRSRRRAKTHVRLEAMTNLFCVPLAS